MSQKKKFEVLEHETIDACLNRMEREGYMPIRRMETPVFQQKSKRGKPEYLKQRIIFEGIKREK